MPETAQQESDLGSRLIAARLPALPQVLLQLLELSDRDDIELGRIAAVVNTDSGIAAKIVNVANSAYFTRGRSITNIHQCLAVLGTSQVRRIALNLSVSTLFASFHKPSGFDLGHYWQHVLSVALIARKLAQKIKYQQVDEAYLAGLLHDVGQLALLSVMPERYMALISVDSDEAKLCEKERQNLGISHAMAGAMLARKWKMNPFFIDALLYHHESAERILDAHQLVQILAVADHLSVMDAIEIKLDHPLLTRWGFNADSIESMLTSTQDEVKTLAEELGIKLPPKHDKSDTSASAQAELAEALSQRLESQNILPEEDESRPTEELLRNLLRSARILFETTAAAIFTEKDGFLIGHPSEVDDGRIVEISIATSAAHSSIARAFHGERSLAGLAPEEESLADTQVIHALGCQRLLCLPMMAASQCQGVLAVGLKADAAEEFLRKPLLLQNFGREAGRRLATSKESAISQDEDMKNDLEQRFDTQVRKVIHEVSNPLSVVRNYIALLREQLTERKQAQQDCDLIEGELRRVARILEQLKTPTTSSPVPNPALKAGVDVNALINEVERLSKIGRPELQKVEIQLHLDPSIPPATTDADKLKQILLNLIFNAAEAMPDGGRIVLGTAWKQTAMSPGQIEISIQDNGPGLPAAVLENLYQPVQSSKGQQHQGLGLSIISKLVDELGGSKQCHSTASGTTFRILLAT